MYVVMHQFGRETSAYGAKKFRKALKIVQKIVDNQVLAHSPVDGGFNDYRLGVIHAVEACGSVSIQPGAYVKEEHRIFLFDIKKDKQERQLATLKIFGDQEIAAGSM